MLRAAPNRTARNFLEAYLQKSQLMNFEFAEAINAYLERSEFSQAIQLAETKLAALTSSPFHPILGKTLLDQTDSLCLWIDNFYTTTATNFSVQALYFEITEFDVNTDVWSIDGFAYAEDGGLEDTEWLADVEEEAISDDAFVVQGYEEVQQAFEEEDLDESQDARDWCEQLIIARYMQLIDAAHRKARERNLAWATLPIYCTEHGYDFIVRSINK